MIGIIIFVLGIIALIVIFTHWAEISAIMVQYLTTDKLKQDIIDIVEATK